MKRILFTLVFTLCCSVIFAQTGVIKGKVFDATDGEPLIGATVIIEGTTKGSSTDLDGNYTIRDTSPGLHNLVITFISYEKKTITGIEVKEGETTVLPDIMLSEASDVLQEIVIQAEVIKTSENALLTVQKKSPKLLDGITSEQFKRNGDNTAAAAVKRVTGVTIDGGKYIYVRGLGDRYSKTVLNGAVIPGVDPNRNGVQLDLFPSNLIDNIIVYKNFSPELPADFTGGYINIETKDFPDRLTIQFSVSTSVNTRPALILISLLIIRVERTG